MSYDVEPYKNDSTPLTSNDNTALYQIHRAEAKALIRAAVTIVDGDSEYETGDSFARIATMIDTHNTAVTVRIDDSDGDARIEIIIEKNIRFRAIARSYSDFQIDIYLPGGDWRQTVLSYASGITPTHRTFNDDGGWI